ncbi:hypothetical protein [Meiothermus hypogaeus]|nr:hypothetical protein [Meiothermus hypogaeus]RIH80567.1 hypothetical protein Mhypo_00485 [Meiothermus hypogaeus]GIW36158.1 MAG: hypothetical protein KatS3mg073_0303 [Meiothermus sp.]
MALTVQNLEVERLPGEAIEEFLRDMQDLLPKGRRPAREEGV